MLTEGIRRWQSINFQPPSIDGSPVCPHYSIIEICAPFADISEENLATRRKFCGSWEKHSNTMDRPGGGSAETRYEAMASCRQIYGCLKEKLTLLKETITLPSEDEVRQKIADAPLREADEIIADYNSKSDRLNRQQVILSDWQKIIFNLSMAPKGEVEENPHFGREISKPEELSRETVIKHVEAFFGKLEEIVGKEKEGMIRISGKVAQNCTQSPSSRISRTGLSD